MDVGCGAQPYRGAIETAGLRYEGVDWPNSIHESDASDPVKWDLTKTPWPFADAQFDALLCTEVLEHIPDPRRFIQECARVCRSGALMVLTTPMTWPEHEAPYDYYRFTRFGLRALFEDAGFWAEEIVARGGWNTALAQLVGFWVCHAFPKPWRYLLQVLAWPAVAILPCLDYWMPQEPEHLLTLGYAVFARRDRARRTHS